MSWGGIKRTTADIEFSKVVRASVGKCERCGKPPDDNSHFYGRRNKSTRYAAENCSSLCRGCHNYFGEHPHEHTLFMQNKLGDGGYARLVEKANQICKISKQEEKAIAKHYRLQLKHIEERRNNGETGVIPFESYQ